MTIQIRLLSVVVALGLLASGCSSKPVPVATVIPTPKASPTWHDFPVQPLSDAEKLRLKQHIYFEFDNSTIDFDAFNVVAAHGQYLAENPDVKVLVEGHSDERGNESYNRKLGMDRAKSIVRVLEQHGVQKRQIIIRSYSADKPIGRGDTEWDYSLNRRASIFY